jgi:hypothetical protein
LPQSQCPAAPTGSWARVIKASSHPTVSAFDAVDVKLPIAVDITVQEGAAQMIRIDGYENLLSHVVTKVVGHKLKIYTDLDPSWSMDCDNIVCHIIVPSMAALSLSGAPDADVHGNIAGDEFKLGYLRCKHRYYPIISMSTNSAQKYLVPAR